MIEEPIFLLRQYKQQKIWTMLQTLMKNFSEGIDYFQVLVQVFQQVMLSKDHSYLKNFMIIPSLCINYVDTIRVI